MRSIFARLVRLLVGSLTRAPFALGLTVLVWATGAITHSLPAGPSPTMSEVVAVIPSAVGQGRWWTLFTSMLFTGNLASYLLATGVLLGLLGLAERTMGTFRTATAFGLGHLLGVMGYLLLTTAGSQAGEDWLGTLYRAPVLGPYAGALAAVVAAGSWFSVLWRRRLRLLCALIPVTLVLYVGHPQSLLTALGVAAGLLLGRAFHGPRTDTPVFRATARETRILLAMVVAIFATGPLLASASHPPVGPLADLRDLVIGPLPSTSDLSRNCTATAGIPCPEAVHTAGLTAVGTVALSIVPLALLLVCAEGLRRGSRVALWTTVLVQMVLGVLAAFYLQLFALFTTRDVNGVGKVQLPVWALEDVLPAVLIPLLLAALLIVKRRCFAIAPVPATARLVIIGTGAAFVIIASGYVIAWFLEGNAAGHRNAWLSVLAGLPRMFVPYPFPLPYALAHRPHGVVSPVLFAAGGAVFWLICLFGLLMMFHRGARAVRDPLTGPAHARSLVHTGGGSLSRMALWPNNRYWFTPDGRAGIAYQLHHGVAITVAGPFGRRDEYTTAIEQFSRFCAAEGLVPCFYSITEDHWDRLEELGFRRVPVAQEALLAVRDLEFIGKRWQNVRTAGNKAIRLGVRAHWSRYRDLPLALRTQLHEISETWVADKGLPEMGFTLGGVNEMMDDEVQLCLAVDQADRVHGVLSWLPVFQDGTVISWTLDFMRRHPNGFKGVIDFLIAAAVTHFRDDVEVISLSGSPLSLPSRAGHGAERAESIEPAEGSALQQMLQVLGRRLEPVYGFASLAAFKNRFHPKHRTLYLAYPDPLALPRIGRAITEAYTPGLTLRQTARLLRTLGSEQQS